MIRLTSIGKLLLIVGVLLGAASLTSQSSLLLLIIGLFLGCGVVNAFLARQALAHLEVHPPRSVRLREGESLAVPWRLVNPGRSPAALLVVALDPGAKNPGLLAGAAPPEQAGPSAPGRTARKNTGAVEWFRVALVPPGGEVRVLPTLAAARRGVHAFDRFQVSSQYPFGLVRVTRRLQAPGEMVVAPAVYPAPAPPVAGLEAMVGGKSAGRHRSLSGSQFAGVRPLGPQDPLKNIHWPSSAKGLGLMVKTFEEELSGRAAFVLAAGRATAPDLLDDALRAVASLAFAVLEAGHHIEFVDLDALEVLAVPPFGDADALLDRLARLPAPQAAPDADRFRLAVARLARKASVNLVLTDASDEAAGWAAELLAARRVVSVCLPAQAPARAWPAGVRVFTYTAQQIQEAG